MSVYLDIKSLYSHLKVNWNVLMCKICIARRLVVDIFPWCNANFVPFPSGTLVALRMQNGSILHLSGNSPPVERDQLSDATSAELSQGTCIQPAVGVRPSILRSPLGASPKSGRLVEHWVDDRPESATTRLDLGRLLSWRCTLGALFECDCHRELFQIQASSMNSLKFSIPQIWPGPFLNVTYKALWYTLLNVCSPSIDIIYHFKHEVCKTF